MDSPYVTEYNIEGFVKEHPEISVKWAHGCGSFVGSSDERVSYILKKLVGTFV